MPLTRGPGVWLLMGLLVPEMAASAADLRRPEQVLRTLVQANADKDLATMARFMAHDEDTVGYSIGGRAYRDWSGFARDMEEEFRSVARLEIPIIDLKVWTTATSPGSPWSWITSVTSRAGRNCGEPCSPCARPASWSDGKETGP